MSGITACNAQQLYGTISARCCTGALGRSSNAMINTSKRSVVNYHEAQESHLSVIQAANRARNAATRTDRLWRYQPITWQRESAKTRPDAAKAAFRARR
jgi:hypothetical protein